jgi:colicin import membrane protein
MKINRLVTLHATLAAVMALAVVFAPAIHAADRAESAAARKARQDEENLKKYDKNHDGKLDDEEKAAMKTDEAKATAEKKEAAALAAEKRAADAEKRAAAAEAKEKAAEKKAGER